MLNKKNVKNQKMSLRTWMAIKIIPALLLLLYYWMCVRKDYRPEYVALQDGVIVCFFIFLVLIRRKRDVFDECAQKTLGRTDSICFKASYIIYGILVLTCVF